MKIRVHEFMSTLIYYYVLAYLESCAKLFETLKDPLDAWNAHAGPADHLSSIHSDQRMVHVCTLTQV